MFGSEKQTKKKKLRVTTSDPVSYTHLDVYKRQVMRCVNKHS